MLSKMTPRSPANSPTSPRLEQPEMLSQGALARAGAGRSPVSERMSSNAMQRVRSFMARASCRTRASHITGPCVTRIRVDVTDRQLLLLLWAELIVGREYDGVLKGRGIAVEDG